MSRKIVLAEYDDTVTDALLMDDLVLISSYSTEYGSGVDTIVLTWDEARTLAAAILNEDT